MIIFILLAAYLVLWGWRDVTLAQPTPIPLEQAVAHSYYTWLTQDLFLERLGLNASFKCSTFV